MADLGIYEDVFLRDGTLMAAHTKKRISEETHDSYATTACVDNRAHVQHILDLSVTKKDTHPTIIESPDPTPPPTEMNVALLMRNN